MISSKTLEHVGKFLGGVEVWGCQDNMMVYAKCSEDEFTPVAHEDKDGRIILFMPECQRVAKFHGTI
jgi:hypothetical protein